MVNFSQLAQIQLRRGGVEGHIDDALFGQRITLQVDPYHLARQRRTRHLKTYTAGKIVEVGGSWMPTRLAMRTDHSAQNTIVERTGIKLNVGLQEDLFSPPRLADFPYERY